MGENSSSCSRPVKKRLHEAIQGKVPQLLLGLSLAQVLRESLLLLFHCLPETVSDTGKIMEPYGKLLIFGNSIPKQQ